MEAIACQRAVQLSTVQTYIAEAMAADYSYPWHRMRLPFSTLASLCGHVRAYHKQQLLADARLLEQQQSNAGGQTQDSQQHQAAPEEPLQGLEVQSVSATGCHGVRPGVEGLHQGGQYQQQQQLQYGLQRQQHKQPLPEQHSACHQQGGQLPVQQAAAVVLQSKPADVGDASKQAVWRSTDIMHGQALCGHCGLLQGIGCIMLQSDGRVFALSDSSTCLSAAHVQSQQPVQLPDMQLVRELVMTSKGTKAIRDSMDTLVLSYGDMRVAIAHIYCLLQRHACSCQQSRVVSN